MATKENNNRIDLLKWFINTVVIGLLTFFFTWVLNERKQGVEEIKVYNTYVELVTKVDGLAERRLLAEFFSNVTVSSKLKEGWEDYYNILDLQYKNEYILKARNIICDANQKWHLNNVYLSNLGEYTILIGTSDENGSKWINNLLENKIYTFSEINEGIQILNTIKIKRVNK